MQVFFLNIQLKPVYDEILKTIEHVLLNKPQIAGQLLMMDKLLYLIIKANSLHNSTLTKFL